MIGDLYQQYAPVSVSFRQYVKDAKISDSEIITISICGELVDIDSENAWFSFVKKNDKHLLPKIGRRSRFNRTRRALLQTTELLRKQLLNVFSIPNNRYFIIDSFPLKVYKFGRAHFVIRFGATELIMENAHPKKKLILATKYMQ